MTQILPQGSLLAELQLLSSTGFENFVYDLVVASGLQNAVWRTPGSDEGRDIEGEIMSTDFSNHRNTARWYIECKRYSSAVDWPKVWEKISYADAHQADYLLIVTTAHLSPQCKSQVANWNSKQRRPAVRTWDAAALESILLRYPQIALKYRLSTDERLIPPSFLALARNTSKIIQAAYGAAEISNYQDSALDAASALAELLTVRMEDIEDGRGYNHYAFSPDQDAYDRLQLSVTNPHRFDRYGLRALLTAARHVTGYEKLKAEEIDEGVVHVPIAQDGIALAAVSVLSEIALWADVELEISGTNLVLRARGRNDN